MKYFRLILITAFLSLFLAGCVSPSGIVGSWEEEIQVDILGMGQDGTAAAAVTRFTFRENGRGSWETTILDGSHPAAVREFSYTLEDDSLTLHYESDTADTVFSTTFEGDLLILDSQRGSFRLNRVK